MGRTLGETTAVVDVNDEGQLRVMARNDAVRREVLARAEHIIAAWNTLARDRGGAVARGVVCWVNTRVGSRCNVLSFDKTAGEVRRRNVDVVQGEESKEDDIAAIFERIRAKRDAASRRRRDGP